MLYPLNLFAWREKQREQHRRRFIGLLVFGGIAALGVQWGAGQYFQYQQDQQQQRLAYLTDYIARIDQRIEVMKIAQQAHSQTLERLKIVEGLQSERNKTTEFMNLMLSVIPEGVHVDKIKMNDYKVEISGIADSTARLTTMIDNMERSPKLRDVGMHSIVHGKVRFGKEFQTFRVSFMFKGASMNDGKQHG
ncbi:PilN domain-containing protein [Vibrio sp. AND4]|uniref:PilN domain-containing protein n=1 Tax=Vibrio sp. AND4 TaxID=314289 RepID=UPI00015F035D|nr:PilN domain-containing protein [Vibrio sp. AND4]EDP57924.1 putative fimbrial assembly protein PilN [Vibrio sp. AND4]